jgi:hypothetical protein
VDRRNAACLLVASVLAATSCSRDDDGAGAEPTVTTVTTATSGGAGADRLDAGAFGDLEHVCEDGDSSGATDIGVTDDQIRIGTVTDKSFSARPGLTAEMYDAAVAFARWCNDHGGIDGRALVVADRDAAVVDYNARIVEACGEDLALVGGGATLDDADNGGRVGCGLPSFPAYAVSAAARSAGPADRQVHAVPNPIGEVNAGLYQAVVERHPELAPGFGIMTAQFGSTLLVRDHIVQAAEASGFTTVFDEEYSATGESSWRPFVEGMRGAGVRVLEFVGEGTFLAQVLEAMEAVGWFPDLVLVQANFYDAEFAALVGELGGPVRVRLQHVPMELAGESPATADYLELMDRYEPDGKTALLGIQATSALLLFARAAAACGSQLTRECVVEEAASIEGWTGGGLHAPQDTTGATASPCYLAVAMDADGFRVDEELTGAADGLFNCDPDNVVALH